MVVGALGLAALSILQGPSIPEGFQPLVDRLQNSNSIQVEFLWTDPGSGRQLAGEFRSNKNRKNAVDILEGPKARLTMIDGTVKIITPDIQWPIPSLNERGGELYDEFWSGFANSDWSAAEPPKRGVFPAPEGRNWARIKLPFDWSHGHTLLLGTDKEDGRLRTLIVEASNQPNVSIHFRQFRGGTTTVPISDGPQMWIVIEDVRWNHPISAEDLDPAEHP